MQYKFPATVPTLETKFPVRRFDFDGRTLSEAGFDLLSSLLTLDPEKRATAEEALKHRWYSLICCCSEHHVLACMLLLLLHQHDLVSPARLQGCMAALTC